jgi:hypothetical protein
MNHHTTAYFWECYGGLPEAVQRLADANYELLRADPRHPSLHFKRVGRLWSVRVGIGYRALAVNGDDGPVWFWIGSHAEYNRIIRGS